MNDIKTWNLLPLAEGPKVFYCLLFAGVIYIYIIYYLCQFNYLVLVVTGFMFETPTTTAGIIIFCFFCKSNVIL